MSRYALTPILSVRAYGVDQVFKDGSHKRIQTFGEKELTQALRLLASLNGTLVCGPSSPSAWQSSRSASVQE
jgi:hypothetical protein